MPSRFTWDEAPDWVRQQRARKILASTRPLPDSRDWRERRHALMVAERDLQPSVTRDLVAAEVRRMKADAAAFRQRADLAANVYRTDDERRMLFCEMRDPAVRGLTKAETKAQRICYVDGTPLEGRRIYWCSDECVSLWTSNHEWAAASEAAARRDDWTCQHCGYRSVLICGAGHKVEQAWPCPEHLHPGFRHAKPTEAEPGVCGRCRMPWPCDVAARGEEFERVPLKWDPSRTIEVRHWQIAKSRVMEVNHKIPRAGAGYSQGCHHHLGSLPRRILANVGGEGHDPIWVVMEHAESEVATGAQDAAHPAGRVVVVNVGIGNREARAADGARVILRSEDAAVLGLREVVVEPQVARTKGAPLRAEPGVGTTDELDATQVALARAFGDATPMAPHAPVRAEPEAMLVEWTPALKAGGEMDRAICRAVTPPAGLMLRAEAIAALAELRASLDGTWLARHAVIVLGTPAAEMPPLAPGLETLCHPCHVVVTTEQVRARKAAAIHRTALERTGTST